MMRVTDFLGDFGRVTRVLWEKTSQKNSVLTRLRTGVYFGHHNVKITIMKILEVYQNPATLVFIVKVLRQAFKW
jgi:hypothetical protein